MENRYKDMDEYRRYQREYQRAYRARRPDYVKAVEKKSKAKHAAKRAEYQRKYNADRPGHRYGLTPESYQRLVNGQHGLCAICGADPAGKRLCVDHDHSTGAVRGLLCKHCNYVLGHAKDSPANLRAAADYLDKRRGAN